MFSLALFYTNIVGRVVSPIIDTQGDTDKTLSVRLYVSEEIASQSMEMRMAEAVLITPPPFLTTHSLARGRSQIFRHLLIISLSTTLRRHQQLREAEHPARKQGVPPTAQA